MKLDHIRALVVCYDLIWPATHGYRIDVHRRMARLAESGVKLGIVMLSRESDEAIEASTPPPWIGFCRSYGKSSYCASPKALLKRLLYWPWPIAARHLDEELLRRLVVDIEEFDPNLIISEGLYGAELVRRIAGSKAQPLLVYRSHNIEHQYMREQMRAAGGLRSWLTLALSNIHLQARETEAIKSASIVLDISEEDSKYWSSKGQGNVTCLPPFPRTSIPMIARDLARWDVAFCGNLNAPNNVEAVFWFVNEVWPRVKEAGGAKRSLVLAGSAPTRQILALAGTDSGISVLANPADMDVVVSQSRVLINPTRRGSGVNIKTVDMIASGLPIVVTDVGTRGLPQEIRSMLGAANSSDDWVESILNALTRPAGKTTGVSDLYSMFVESSYTKVVSSLARMAPRVDPKRSINFSVNSP
jgi:polysaccharide biosynthesis protein PslH